MGTRQGSPVARTDQDLEDARAVFRLHVKPPVIIRLQITIEVAQAVAGVPGRHLPCSAPIRKLLTNIVAIVQPIAVPDIEEESRHDQYSTALPDG